MNSKNLVLIVLLILGLFSCEEDCDCHYTIITAGEQFLLDNQTSMEISDADILEAKHIVQFCRDSFPKDYRYRSLNELCKTAEGSKERPCNISFFITKANSNFSIEHNYSNKDDIKINSSIKPMVINGYEFILHSCIFPNKSNPSDIRFEYSKEGISYFSKPYRLQNGIVYYTE